MTHNERARARAHSVLRVKGIWGSALGLVKEGFLEELPFYGLFTMTELQRPIRMRS